MAAATISMSDGNVFEVLTLLTLSGGFLLERPGVQEEELITAGVDGARWRTVGRRFPKVVVQTLSSYTTFKNATFWAGQMQEVSGTGRVRILADSFVYDYKNVHVGPVVAVPRKGAPVGAGAGASDTAHVVAEWTLQLTEFDQSVNQ